MLRVDRDDVASPDETGEGPRATGRAPIIIGVAGVVAVAFVLVALLSSDEVVNGVQVVSPSSVELRAAPTEVWRVFDGDANAERADFPRSLISTVDDICIGFERTDFVGDDPRPSLARCVAPALVREDELRSLMSVAMGFDTLHFVEVGGDVRSVEVELASGGRVESSRVLTSERIIALRLENGADLAALRWTIGDVTMRCTPEPDGWRTAVFCRDLNR